jgi:DNA polymerase III delta prime subunit
MFKKAVKHEAKLRLAIAGPSGSGKTYTALALATSLGSKVAYIDTEHNSASKYADLFDFDVMNMTSPYHPDKFSDGIKSAVNGGYDVVVLDSLSHAWSGSGGLLQIVDHASKKFKGNSYAGWSEGTPIQDRLIEAIVSANIHVICTMRSKQDYILVEKNGRQTPQKVGMAPVQRDGFEYEFDIFLDMDTENNAIVSKTRCSEIAGALIPKPGKELADILAEWLSGVKAEPVALPYEIGQEVMVQGRNDEKLGSFVGMAGVKLLVNVGGKEFPIDAERVTPVGDFLEEELPVTQGALIAGTNSGAHSE